MALGLTVAGCFPALPAVPPSSAATATPGAAASFDPLAFFDGRTEGVGVLRIRGRSAQAVRVESVGRRLPDGRLELRQLVRLGDAPAEERTWVFERLDPEHFGGTLTDATGPVDAWAEGPRFQIRYPMGGGMWMSQELTLEPGGRSAQNRATVRFRGIPVARLSEQIRRVVEP